MKDKVLATIKANEMIKQGDRVIVGLSGGADSVALLCVLLELKDELGITLSAVHINHCLRGAESDSDELFCQKLCDEKGIDFTAHRIDVKSYCEQNKIGTEEGARALRYSIFEAADPTAKIATAHTLSDNVETVIMNLARGSALDGICGIPPVRGRIIRPIIDCGRSDVEAFLAKLGQSYVTDSTNLTDDYSRNRVRHNVIPILKQLNPELERSVKRSCDSLRNDRALLDSMAEKAIKAAFLPEKATKKGFKRLKTLFNERKTLSIDMIKEEPQPIRMRIYKKLLSDFSQSCDFARLAKIDELVQNGEGVYPLGKTICFGCNGEELYIERRATSEPIEPVIIDLNDENLPFEMKIHGGIFRIRCLKQTEIKFFVNNFGLQFKNAIDCDKINNTAILRPRKQGERIALLGRNCTQTFKNLLNTSGLSQAARDSLIVCESGGKTIWLEGFGVCESAKLTPDTKKAIIFEISED